MLSSSIHDMIREAIAKQRETPPVQELEDARQPEPQQDDGLGEDMGRMFEEPAPVRRAVVRTPQKMEEDENDYEDMQPAPMKRKREYEKIYSSARKKRRYER
jgi:hypothetical protein